MQPVKVSWSEWKRFDLRSSEVRLVCGLYFCFHIFRMIWSILIRVYPTAVISLLQCQSDNTLYMRGVSTPCNAEVSQGVFFLRRTCCVWGCNGKNHQANLAMLRNNMKDVKKKLSLVEQGQSSIARASMWGFAGLFRWWLLRSSPTSVFKLMLSLGIARELSILLVQLARPWVTIFGVKGAAPTWGRHSDRYDRSCGDQAATCTQLPNLRFFFRCGVVWSNQVCLPLLSPRLDSTVVASLGLVPCRVINGC